MKMFMITQKQIEELGIDPAKLEEIFMCYGIEDIKNTARIYLVSENIEERFYDELVEKMKKRTLETFTFETHIEIIDNDISYEIDDILEDLKERSRGE